MTFRDMDVSVTMTGEEWFTLIAKLTYGDSVLSPKGREVYRSVQRKLADQVRVASDANPEVANADAS